MLPARLDRYAAASLDMLCLTGQVGWSRLSAPIATAGSQTPRAALFVRSHADAWQTLRFENEAEWQALAHDLDGDARILLETLKGRGASFLRDLRHAVPDAAAFAHALSRLALNGLVTSDGFAGVRAVTRIAKGRQADFDSRADGIGRWSAIEPVISNAARETAIEAQARALLDRYGVVCRRLLERETNVASWRDLLRVYRRLEARGEIRGGRFVTGVTGQQFALPDAVERLREIRRHGADGQVIVISAVDPLNLTGVLTSGERVRAVTGTRVAFRDGVAVTALVGDYLQPLSELDAATAAQVGTALAGRRVPVGSGFVGRV